jgi:transcriptional regulator with XRE-family HTH domain
MSERMTVGERIKSRIEALGLNQSFVARQLGVSRQMISSWVKDRTKIRPDKVPRLAAMLEVDPCLLSPFARAANRLRTTEAMWQPIATAPKDEAVLLYAGGYLVGRFDMAHGTWSGYSVEAETHNLNTWNKPTHWMKLPAPPRDAFQVKD